MIHNRNEYNTAYLQRRRLTRQLKSLEQAEPETGQKVKKRVQIKTLRTQLETLDSELAAYENIRNHHISSVTITSLEDLPKALIQARIAAGISQRDLAMLLGIRERNVQRLESQAQKKYATASLERLQSIALALKVTVRIEIEFDPSV